MQVKATPSVLSQKTNGASSLSHSDEGISTVRSAIASLSLNFSDVSPMNIGNPDNASQAAQPNDFSNSAAYWKAQYERQLAGQALTKTLTNEIRKSSDLAVIYRTALQGVTELFNVSQCMILRLRFWDPRQMLWVADRLPKTRVLVESSWPVLTHDSTDLENPTTTQSYWISECEVTQAAMKSFPNPLQLNSYEEFQDCVEDPSLIINFLDPQVYPSLVMIPLDNKKKPLGFLVLQQEQVRPWLDAEIDFIELMAGQISSAIIQTETLRQVESIVEDRTAQLQHSVDLQGKLYELNRKQIERLREMNKRMDEFLSTLSHELRTPLTSMMLAIRMLREASLSPERRSQYLNILEQQCAQETNLINDLLALQELESKQITMQVQPVDLNDMTQELQAGFEERWNGKGLSIGIDIEDNLRISTDVGSLNRVLLELLTNAGKYSAPNTHITMGFSKAKKQNNQQESPQLSIVVSNIGSGIAPSELPHLFEKFRRCQGMTDNAVPGTGLGLALVQSLVQHLGGSITAESIPMNLSDSVTEPPSYITSFTVLLPFIPDAGKG